jgi:hypothetical protein
MFIGRYKYSRGDCAKITLSYVGGGALVILFMAMFYSIYGELSPMQPYAIGKISLFFTAINLVGKIDLLAVYVLDIVLLFALVLNVQMCVHCIECVVGKHLPEVYSLAVNALLIVCCFVFNNHFTALNGIYYNWLWIVSVLFAYIFPCFALVLRRRN